MLDTPLKVASNTDPTDPEGVLKLDNQLCFPLYAASRLITQNYRQHLEKLDLTYLQYLILMVLWEQDQLTVAELGAKLLLDSGTLTPALKKMEKKELIQRQRSKEDDRRVLNSLSLKACKLKKEAAKVPVAVFCKSGLSEEEAIAMRCFAKRLLQVLQEDSLAT